MLKPTLHVTLVSILGIGINFVTQLLLAFYFGATPARDAYFAALSIPAYVTLLFTGSLGMILLPFLVKQKLANNPGETNRFISAVINFSFVVIFIIAILSVLLARQIMDIFLPDSKQALFDTTVYLFRILIVSTTFSVLTGLLSVVFHASHSFLVPALAPVLSYLVTMISVAVFSPSIGIASIAWGTLAGTLISFIGIFILALKQMDFKWHIVFMKPEVKALLLVALPLFLAGILFRSTVVVERLFAARLEDGSLSYLGGGNQIITVLSTIVSSGIATTSFPLLSRYWSERDMRSLEKTLMRLINGIVLIILPMIIIFLATGMDIVKIVFERGAFTASDTKAQYLTLLALMGYFLFSSIGNVVARILYVSQHTWISSLIACAELAIYIIGAFILSSYYSYLGLAISMSLASAFNILLSLIFIRRKIVGIKIRSLLTSTGLTLLLSALVFLIVYFLNHSLLTSLGSVVRVVIVSLVVIVLYWFMLRLIKPEYNKLLLGILRR
jgi:putative peptidoglycan lipid II flippase